MKQRIQSLMVLLFCALPLFAFADVEVVVINDKNLETEVDKSTLPVVVDFYADWCGPCRQMAPEFKKAAQGFDGVVKFGKYNADENEELDNRHHIRSLPTLLFYKNGELIKSVAGYRNAEDIAKLVKSVFQLEAK